MILTRKEVLAALGAPGPSSSDGPIEGCSSRPRLFTIAVLYDCVSLLRQGYEPDIDRAEWWLRFDEIGSGPMVNPVPMTPEQIRAMT